ncbi:hypothetical protein LJB99_06205 [Deltaproteobacteria bacterium OttesenSCG-928-K17]|nr:hypothetical protein [Deltaproteobacteria bacterium OttesenSCG-928-K17]
MLEFLAAAQDASGGFFTYLQEAFFTTPNLWLMLKAASWETLYMVSISSLVAAGCGVPLGVLLVVTRKGHILGGIWPSSALNI